MSGATSNLDQLVQPGHVIAGKYRVERVLGKGGMGVVVAAHHLQLEQTVAIKLMLPEVMASPVLLQRFLREARAVAQLRSEHVCHVHDVGNLDDGTPYMVMEYLTGADLYQLMKERGGRLAITDAAEYVIQACAGMAEAHARGIVHRDLKPHNLFLTQRIDGSPLVKVLDFGVAKAADDFQATTVTSLLGSPAYMAPEQMRTAAAVDARADIYALGAILYAVLVGRMPFKAESLPELCVLVLSEPPEPPSRDRPDIPPALEAIILRCLAKSPDDRYQDVGALAQELAPFAGPRLSGSLTRMPTPLPGQVRAALPSAQVVHSTATGIVAPAPAPPPRRGRAGLVAGGAVLLAAVGGGVWWQMRSKEPGPGVAALPVPTPTPSGTQADAGAAASGLSAPHEVIPGVEGAVDLALSPDGEWIAYVSGGAIFVRELEGGTPERIELDRSITVRTVSWFKGSKQLLAHAETETGQALLAVGRRGGRPTMQLAGARAGAVAPDGRQLAFATDGAIKVANADGSSARERVQLHDGESVPALTWEPHSERIAFLVARPDGTARIDVVRPDGSDRRTLAQGPFVARSGDALLAWSESGIAVVRHDEGAPRALVLLPVDSAVAVGDEQEILALGRKALRGLSVGNGGATLAILMEAEQRDVMVARINGGQGIGSLDRVTEEERDDQLGAWTPDGDALLIQSGALLLRHSLGSDAPREIAAGDGRRTDVVVAPDGRILFWRASDGGKGEVVAVPPDGGTPAAVFTPEGTVWLRCVRGGCFAVERRNSALVIAPLDPSTGRGDDIAIPRVTLSEGNAWDVDADGNVLAAVGTDRIIRFVDLELGSVVASTPTITWRVRSIAFDPAGQALFATGVDQAGEYVIERIARDGKADELQSSRSTRFAYLRVSPKGDRLAVQAEPVDQKLFLIDDPTRRSN